MMTSDQTSDDFLPKDIFKYERQYTFINEKKKVVLHLPIEALLVSSRTLCNENFHHFFPS